MVNNVSLFIQLNAARKRNQFFFFHLHCREFRHFPNCIYGAECLFIHPTCRFAGACTRSDCPYLHSTATPASSPNDATGSSTTRPAMRSESSTVCKYGVQCMRPNCSYSHPRMPFPSARNYKWINNKWYE